MTAPLAAAPAGGLIARLGSPDPFATRTESETFTPHSYDTYTHAPPLTTNHSHKDTRHTRSANMSEVHSLSRCKSLTREESAAYLSSSRGQVALTWMACKILMASASEPWLSSLTMVSTSFWSICSGLGAGGNPSKMP